LHQQIVVDPTQEGLETALGAVNCEQSANLDTLRTLIDSLDGRYIETAEFRAPQAQIYGLLGTDILDAAVFLNVL